MNSKRLAVFAASVPEHREFKYKLTPYIPIKCCCLLTFIKACLTWLVQTGFCRQTDKLTINHHDAGVQNGDEIEMHALT